MEFLIKFLIVEIILVAIMFVVFWCILANYIVSYLNDIDKVIEKCFRQLNKAIYESAEYIVKNLNKRD